MAKITLEEEGEQVPRGRHIKKRALRNKSLSVSFDEKDLQEFVTGFHKRKKKRRKEAQQKIHEADRRKRIESRKKRRLERQMVTNGGVLPDYGAQPIEHEEDGDEDDEDDIGSDFPKAHVSGTTMYDNGDVQVTVTTSEISRGQEDLPVLTSPPAPYEPSCETKDAKRKKTTVSKKKPMKKVSKRKSRARPQSKRDKRKKGKMPNKNS
ncbi:unnamed protein product [Cuscuta epithymum]|uniref:Ribosomal RNA-processing protein 17 n=1 Tax=Cuscuta epithymum TaxID=186058 RepID=A0AAV0F5U5_9ASTE|nr:unnamed protein product [Cuscuta epithymum]